MELSSDWSGLLPLDIDADSPAPRGRGEGRGERDKFCARPSLILQNFTEFSKFSNISEHFRKVWQNSSNFQIRKNVILELCKGVHCVDLGESFQTHIFLQDLASIQPRTSPFKFARSPRRDVNRCALLVLRPSWKRFRAACFPFETQSGSLLLNY